MAAEPLHSSVPTSGASVTSTLPTLAAAMSSTIRSGSSSGLTATPPGRFPAPDQGRVFGRFAARRAAARSAATPKALSRVRERVISARSSA